MASMQVVESDSDATVKQGIVLLDVRAGARSAEPQPGPGLVASGSPGQMSGEPTSSTKGSNAS